MSTNFPKPKRTDIIASKSEIYVRRFFQWIITIFAFCVMLPVILFSSKEFFSALLTWIGIIGFSYLFIRPVYNFFHDRIFNYEERYRKQIIDRLLYWYSYKTDIDWDQAKKHVDLLEKKYPTAKSLEDWLDSKEEKE